MKKETLVKVEFYLSLLKKSPFLILKMDAFKFFKKVIWKRFLSDLSFHMKTLLNSAEKSCFKFFLSLNEWKAIFSLKWNEGYKNLERNESIQVKEDQSDEKIYAEEQYRAKEGKYLNLNSYGVNFTINEQLLRQ